jgi:hypothetical protein
MERGKSMKVTIPLIALARGGPLRESQKPQDTDEKHLSFFINKIMAIRQGLVSVKVDYDDLDNNNKNERCKIKLVCDGAKAQMELNSDENKWNYEATVTFDDGEVRQFEGDGHHDSKQAVVRKVEGLIRIMLEN